MFHNHNCLADLLLLLPFITLLACAELVQTIAIGWWWQLKLSLITFRHMTPLRLTRVALGVIRIPDPLVVLFLIAILGSAPFRILDQVPVLLRYSWVHGTLEHTYKYLQVLIVLNRNQGRLIKFILINTNICWANLVHNQNKQQGHKNLTSPPLSLSSRAY